MLFEFPYMQILFVLSNRSYTGFKPELFTSKVRLRTLWATEQTYHKKKHSMKLDMCDANVQKQQFSNLPEIFILFEVITWYSSSNSAKITLY